MVTITKLEEKLMFDCPKKLSYVKKVKYTLLFIYLTLISFIIIDLLLFA